MRKAIGGCIALLGVASMCASAGAQDGSAKLIVSESKLLGIGLWQKFSDVMKVHGSPTRIELGAITSIQGGGRQAGAGAGGGGMRGGSGALMGAGGGAPMMGGGPMMGAGGGGQNIGASIGNMMSMKGRGASGYSGMGGSGAPGLPGMGSTGLMGGKGGDDGGGGGGGSRGALMGSGGGGGESSDSSDGEQTWVYERGGLTHLFLFNKDGRVIQIQTFGYSSKDPRTRTKNGVNLGDSIANVYGTYGWAGNTIKEDDTMLLDYSRENNVAFQLYSKDGKQPKVVGITIAITEKSQQGIIGFGPSGNSTRSAVGFGGGGQMGMGGRGALMGAGGGGPMMGAGGGGGGRGRRGAGGGGGGTGIRE